MVEERKDIKELVKKLVPLEYPVVHITKAQFEKIKESKKKKSN